MKKIWLVKMGETLPIGDSKKRLLRTGLLAELLVNDGHHVIFWSSTFDHFKKQHLFDQDTDLEIKNGYEIKLLHGKAYTKNVSIDRLKNHSQIVKKFALRIELEKNKPNIIVCSYPLVELAYECVKFGRKYNIPVIIDIRDLWPDIFFMQLLPSSINKLSLRIFNMFFRKHIYALKNATGLIGITHKILDWGLHYAKRSKTNIDQVFHLSYKRNFDNCTPETLSILKKKGIIFGSKIYCCLIGTISNYKFNFEPIIQAAEILLEKKSPIKFIICGEGENLEFLKKRCLFLPNIHFTGWIDQNEINCVMLNCQIGLAPYTNNFTYLTSIPSKISEYLSYGLVIMSGLKGYLKEYIEVNNAGYFYNSGIDLADKLIGFSLGIDKIENYCSNNKNLFEENFSSLVVYNKFKNIIIHNSN